MNETLTSEQIVEICVALAMRLQGLDASLFLKVKEVLKHPGFVNNLLELFEDVREAPLVSVTACETLKPLVGDEILKGTDFIKRSQALVRGSGKRALSREDYESLKREENRHLLPSFGDRIIVFLGTEFKEVGSIFILALRCDGDTWSEAYFDLALEFDQRFEVAVSGVFLPVVRS